MRLSAYIEQPGKSAAGLARQCGVSPSTITRAAKGEIAPTLRLMQRILECTDGVVTPNDYLPAAAE